MKRFIDYFVIRETGETEQVKSEFDQLRSQIGGMFSSLYRAAQNTWGKGSPSLGDRMKQDVISGLEAIIAKIKGGESVKAECYSTGQEIEKLLNEAGGIVDNIQSKGKSVTGRATYNMMDVLKNIEGKIMQSVHNLEQSVLGRKIDALKSDLGSRTDALGNKVDTVGNKVDTGVSDIRGDVAGYGQRTDKMGADFDSRHADLVSKLSGIQHGIDNPRQPLPHAARDAAHQSMQILKGLTYYAKDHGIKLIHPSTGDKIKLSSLNTPEGQSALLGMASKDATFKLVHAGDPEGTPFNIGDITNVDSIVQSFMNARDIDPNAYAKGSKSGRPFGWTDGRTVKKIKVDGVKGSTAEEAKKSQQEFDDRETERRNNAARKQFGESKQECIREWLGINIGEK